MSASTPIGTPLLFWKASVHKLSRMRPGARVDLLRKLATTLAATGYTRQELELTLDEFGIPTNMYTGEVGPKPWLLAQLQQSNDEQLVELDEYVSAGGSRESLEPSDLPWESGTFRLFISHTHAHSGLAAGIKTTFAPWRLDAFVAHTTIEPTREWERVIDSALGSCDALAALITDDFVNSKWCDQEVGYCLSRRVPIVPVKLGADPHGFISKYQAVTPRYPNRPPWVADDIFRALVRHPAVRGALAGPVVHRFAASGSFDGARNNFELLRQLPQEVWTRDLVDIAERAAIENDQIEHAVVILAPRQNRPMPEMLTELLTTIRERLGMDSPPPTISDDDIPF